jgi:hypothetical protein
MMIPDQPTHPLEMEATSFACPPANAASLSIIHKPVAGCAVFGTTSFKPITQDFATFYESLLALQTIQATLPNNSLHESDAAVEPVTPDLKSFDCTITEPAVEDVGQAEVADELANPSVAMSVKSEDGAVAEADTIMNITTEHTIPANESSEDVSVPDATPESPVEDACATEDHHVLVTQTEEHELLTEIKEDTPRDENAHLDNGDIIEEEASAVGIPQEVDQEITQAAHEELGETIESISTTETEVIPVAEDELAYEATEDTPPADSEVSPVSEDELSVCEIIKDIPAADSEVIPVAEEESAMSDTIEVAPTTDIIEKVNEGNTRSDSDFFQPESEINQAIGSEANHEIEPENNILTDTCKNDSENDSVNDLESDAEDASENESENDEIIEAIHQIPVLGEKMQDPVDISTPVPVWPIIYEDDFDACISSPLDTGFELFLTSDNSWSIPTLAEKGKSERDIVKERLANRETARFNRQNLRLEQASRALTINGPVQVPAKSIAPSVEEATPVTTPAPQKEMEMSASDIGNDTVDSLEAFSDNEEDAVELAKAIASGSHSRTASSR